MRSSTTLWCSCSNETFIICFRRGVPLITTLAAASAAAQALRALDAGDWTVSSIQEIHRARVQPPVRLGSRIVDEAS